ncbi:AP-1 complex subunit mu-2 [Camellia lanceoleosa]|uniref:AP-1 complex subunit mu-2 n=1 Tax=Camellia lanceoleosa TaxID=1840588 RepID=A0ACC0HQI2_9ERIC|nr:AP-1 complex subunit mu-2 [Camellia lanceoleosa]
MLRLSYCSTNATNPNVRTSLGSASYALEKDALIWKIKSFPGGKEYMLRAEYTLPNITSEDAAPERKAPIRVKFEIPYFAVSGIQGINLSFGRYTSFGPEYAYPQVLIDTYHCYCVILNADGGAAFPSEKTAQDCSSSDISSLKINTGSGKTVKTKLTLFSGFVNSADTYLHRIGLVFFSLSCMSKPGSLEPLEKHFLRVVVMMKEQILRNKGAIIEVLGREKRNEVLLCIIHGSSDYQIINSVALVFFEFFGRSLGELVRKLGERVLPLIIPILSRGLKDPNASRRQVRLLTFKFYFVDLIFLFALGLMRISEDMADR